jgi:protein-disulfide isomerase
MSEKNTIGSNLPSAIIIAATMICISLLWINHSNKNTNVPKADTNTQQSQSQISDITSNDHILGNPNAPIKIVEYSDTSCPFCKMFHPVMKQIIDIYGPTGKVAWVYRHFPLDKEGTRPDGGILHKNAGNEAQAMECAGALGGNSKFWAYADRLYDVTPAVTGDTPNGLDQKQLPIIAKYVGLDTVSFNECLTSGRFKSKIESQYLDGLNAGITGTPYSVIITPSGSKIPLEGMLPFTRMKSIIETLLSEAK